MDQAEQLRNVIKQKNQNNIGNARVITITSGKGGVGKSNMAVNLAIMFRKMGQRVIILDADFGLANVEVMFGTVPKYNLSDLIFGGKSIREIITTGPMDIGFISGGSGIVGLNNLSKEQISYLVHSLSLLNDLCDVLIIDTAGRLQNKANLMSELSKIRKVIDREAPGALKEVLLVLDATTGQNALSQAKTFGEASGVTGVILTKLDGTAKGGITIGIRAEYDLPVKMIGVGEQINDLQIFDPQSFAAALFLDAAEDNDEEAIN